MLATRQSENDDVSDFTGIYCGSITNLLKIFNFLESTVDGG